jgi:hypothetical protein
MILFYYLSECSILNSHLGPWSYLLATSNNFVKFPSIETGGVGSITKNIVKISFRVTQNMEVSLKPIQTTGIIGIIFKAFISGQKNPFLSDMPFFFLLVPKILKEFASYLASKRRREGDGRKLAVLALTS